MNEHAIRNILEGGGGPAGTLARALLWLPGKLYGAAMRLRREAYRQGIFSSKRADLPVISIGNLTAGGSGKTPTTAWLARELDDLGWKAAILMRGYRQEDGLSDEAVLYQTLAPNALVEVNPDRRAGAKAAAARGANVILLDDGMQHLKLQRDMDIVLIDATSPWGGGNTIPGGLLREPKATVALAHAIVLTRSDHLPPPRLASLRAEVVGLAPGTPIFTARHRPARLVRLDGTPLPVDALRGKNVIALSGIARPEAFRATLEQLGAIVAGSVAGRDHAAFDREFVNAALARAAAAGAVVVMTEKDRCRRIFSALAEETADNSIAAGADPVHGSLLTLGVELDVDDKDRLLALVRETLAGAIQRK
jgi:tetraacyldisaccharide 4'-kinase